MTKIFPALILISVVVVIALGSFYLGRNDAKRQIELDFIEDVLDRNQKRQEINRDSGNTDARRSLREEWSR